MNGMVVFVCAVERAEIVNTLERVNVVSDPAKLDTIGMNVSATDVTEKGKR
ncbi:hypothetical protein N8612_02995 [Verrucomicrobia bacterium]|nr:hypothetical protein [Verrucomicrobiota bacterium]